MTETPEWELELQWRNNSHVAGWYFKKWLCETGRQPWPRDYREVKIVVDKNRHIGPEVREMMDSVDTKLPVLYGFGVAPEVGSTAMEQHAQAQREHTEGRRGLLDNAALQSQPRMKLKGLPSDPSNPDGVELHSIAHPPGPMRDLIYAESWADLLKTQRRESIHPVSWSFPSNVRKRRFGIYHDHIYNVVKPDESIHDTLTSRFYRYTKSLEIDELLAEVTGIMKGARFVQVDGVWYRVYMARWILKTPWFMIRVHRFLRGDDNSAPHDHPFSFITFPLATYHETAQLHEEDLPKDYLEHNPRHVKGQWWDIERTVRCFRFHFRPATYRHFVHEPTAPFWTIVFSSGSGREWGLWLDPETFDSFKNWAKY